MFDNKLQVSESQPFSTGSPFLLFVCFDLVLRKIVVPERCCRGRNESKLEEPPSSRLSEVGQTLLHWANTPTMCYVCHSMWSSLAVVCLHSQWAPDLWGCGLSQSLMSQSVLAGSPLQPSTPKSASRPLTPFFVHRVRCSFLSAIPHIVPLGASHTSFSHSYALSFRRLCPKPQRGRSLLKIPITHPFVPIMILINRK